jgi:hypothetical protein
MVGCAQVTRTFTQSLLSYMCVMHAAKNGPSSPPISRNYVRLWDCGTARQRRRHALREAFDGTRYVSNWWLVAQAEPGAL